MYHFPNGFGVAISPSNASSVAKTTQTDFSCNLSIPTIITSIIEYWGTTLRSHLVVESIGWGLPVWSHEQKQIQYLQQRIRSVFGSGHLSSWWNVVQKSGSYVTICHLFCQNVPFHHVKVSKVSILKRCWTWKNSLPKLRKTSWWLNQPQLKNIERQNGFIFPKVRGGNNKNIWVATTSIEKHRLLPIVQSSTSLS